MSPTKAGYLSIFFLLTGIFLSTPVAAQDPWQQRLDEVNLTLQGPRIKGAYAGAWSRDNSLMIAANPTIWRSLSEAEKSFVVDEAVRVWFEAGRARGLARSQEEITETVIEADSRERLATWNAREGLRLSLK